MTNSELALEIKDKLKTTYPDIIVWIEQDKKDPFRTAVFFVEEKFRDLYPLQRFHYLMHTLSEEYLETLSVRLPNARWYELAPGQAPEDLRYPDEKEIEEITPYIMGALAECKFFEKLDDLMAPADATISPKPCNDNFSLSRSVLRECGFSDNKDGYDEFFDIFHVLMDKGGFCDCEILYNAAPESRSRPNYWTKKAEKSQYNQE